VIAESLAQQGEFVTKIRALNPALLIWVDRSNGAARGLGSKRVVDPENNQARNLAVGFQVMTLHDPRVGQFFEALNPGESAATISLSLPATVGKPVKVRNVVGLLRGSDPILKDTYVLVT